MTKRKEDEQWLMAKWWSQQSFIYSFLSMNRGTRVDSQRKSTRSSLLLCYPSISLQIRHPFGQCSRPVDCTVPVESLYVVKMMPVLGHVSSASLNLELPFSISSGLNPRPSKGSWFWENPLVFVNFFCVCKNFSVCLNVGLSILFGSLK